MESHRPITSGMSWATMTIVMPRSSRKPPDERQQVGRLGRVHARVGLIEHQHAGLRGHGARDLEPSLIAIRQAPGHPLRAASDRPTSSSSAAARSVVARSRRRKPGVDSIAAQNGPGS